MPSKKGPFKVKQKEILAKCTYYLADLYFIITFSSIWWMGVQQINIERWINYELENFNVFTQYADVDNEMDSPLFLAETLMKERCELTRSSEGGEGGLL